MDESATLSLLGIIGHPIAGNPTQFALEGALRAAGLDWQCLSFDVPPEQLSAAIAGVAALGFRGVSIAPPFGCEVARLVQQLSPTSQLTGWVDVLALNSQRQLVGYHLMADAMIDLIGPTKLADAHVALLGNTPKLAALGKALQSHDIGSLWFAEEADDQTEYDVVIRGLNRHSSKVGIADQPALFSEQQIEQLATDCVVVDLAVTASTSPLLRFAANRGIKTFSSIDLFVHRASLAFSLWTGIQADQHRLREAFEEYLEI